MLQNINYILLLVVTVEIVKEYQGKWFKEFYNTSKIVFEFSEIVYLILSQHALHVFCVCLSLQMSEPQLNICFKEQNWPLETSQIWHSFWSHANPQWEYLFSQNLCIIWHDTHVLFEVTHYMHNRHIACLHL